MLYRIVDHFQNNPKRIDKLIAIKGIPEEWLFREGPEGKELKRPWEPDVEKNIPMDIRHLCEPTYVVFRYPPVQAGGKEIIEKRQIIGLRIDYNSEPGRQLWEDIERFVEESTPRNERVPSPVLCAKDERSAFETYAAKRNTRGSLELTPSAVPMVDLTKYIEVKIEKKVEPILIQPDNLETPPMVGEYKCEECDYRHRSKQGIRMHKTKKHPIKEKVGIS